MKTALLILAIVLVIGIYILYRIGKKVRYAEDEFMEMMAQKQEMGRIKKLQDKRSRKSTPKVPRMSKSVTKQKTSGISTYDRRKTTS